MKSASDLSLFQRFTLFQAPHNRLHRLALGRFGGEAQERFEVLRRRRQLALALVHERGVVVRVGEVGLELDRPW